MIKADYYFYVFTKNDSVILQEILPIALTIAKRLGKVIFFQLKNDKFSDLSFFVYYFVNNDFNLLKNPGDSSSMFINGTDSPKIRRAILR